MITIDRILAPVDLSDPSRTPLIYAARFAAWYDARVSVMYVAHALFAPALMGAPRDVAMRSTRRSSNPRQEIERALVTSIDGAGMNPADVDIVIEDGEPAAAILRDIARLRPGLVIMGTHGRSGLGRFVLGSVAEKVLRTATAPVLTVPPTAMASAALPFRRLLCPLDFSAPSLTAFEYALSIAQESDAHLTLLHVVDWPADDTDALVEIAPGTFQYRRSLEEQAERRLETLKARAGTEFCEIACSLASGRPYERIIDTAAAERSDLIVMGVHGRNVLDVAIFGSTANQVVRHATCPVLTLRH